MPIVTTFTGIGVDPDVVSAVAPSARKILVTFSEAMTENAALELAANYALVANGLSVPRSVVAAQATSPTVVELTTDDDLTVGPAAYTVTVSNVVDLAGNPLNIDAADVDVLQHLPVGIPNHCELAIDRLIMQFRGAENLEALICQIVDQIQDLEQVLSDIRPYHSINAAWGVRLDWIGQLYRLPRNGLSDAAYRVRLRAAAYTVTSRARPEDMISILRILLDGSATLSYVEQYPAAFVMETVGIPNEDGYTFARLLRKAKPAAVQFVLLHDLDNPAMFGWDEDASAGIWGEVDDDPLAGDWSEAS